MSATLDTTTRMKSVRDQARERLDAAKLIYDRVYLHWSKNRSESNLQALEKAGSALKKAQADYQSVSLTVKYNHGRMPTVRPQ